MFLGENWIYFLRMNTDRNSEADMLTVALLYFLLFTFFDLFFCVVFLIPIAANVLRFVHAFSFPIIRSVFSSNTELDFYSRLFIYKVREENQEDRYHVLLFFSRANV